MKLLFEKSSAGRRGVELPELDVPRRANLLPRESLREELGLPELSEVDVVRHYTHLSRMNFGVDVGFYPLGSCTMKYNPKINEDISRFDGFTCLHPYSPAEVSQGSLRLMYELERYLSEIIGMDKFTLQPAAGAHGELTGLMLMKAYFENRGEKRTKILIPDSAHGTNPASSVIAGFETVEIKSGPRGGIDVKGLKDAMSGEIAGLMLTNPNTLGIFDENILEIADILHSNGSLFFCDGANANAILGVARPGDMGFDIIQLNLHKTFATPHGGGGPGSGPVGVKKPLVDFLPKPGVEKKGDFYYLDYDKPKSIGRVKAFYGNFNVMVKAYSYIRAMGSGGLRKVAENSVLNANYLLAKLKKHYHLPYDRTCMHEFVLSDQGMPNGVTTNDVAKRLLDYGFHAPTVYFPLIVHGAIMIEPTETESKETLDEFADAMIKIREEAEKDPDLLKSAPRNLPVSRLDAVKAAREPRLRWKKE
jgi:glycine dehydrogenase subunit 2